MRAVLLGAMLALSGPAAATPTLPELMEEIDSLVLAGRNLPVDFLLKLRALPEPADRMTAIVYLRRAGLLRGPAVSLENNVFIAPAFEPQHD